MKLKRILCLLLIFPFLLSGCSDDEKKEGEKYDPSKPVEVKTFMPEEGRLREKVIIQGSNFGRDLSKVRVYFVDSSDEKPATIIGVDNNTIYCLAPRQLPGDNQIKVVVEDKEVLIEKTFNYSQAEVVSTIAGTTGDRRTVDGSLSTGRFGRGIGIAAVGDESVLYFQYDNDVAVRYVSVPENKIVTIQNGFRGSKPAVKKDKSVVYAMGQNSPHVIYQYTKSLGWTPMRIGQLGPSNAYISSCALNETEEWLYFVDNTTKFGRYNLQTQTIEIIKDKLDGVVTGSLFIVYHPLHDCFYMTSEAGNSVYKLLKDGTVSLFSGSNQASSVDGSIAEARYYNPRGLTVDEDGNIYIVQSYHNNFLVRKIIIKQDYVSTIAGVLGAGESQKDGKPLESTFHWPIDIDYDGEGGFWICEDWGHAVRKYAVE